MILLSLALLLAPELSFSAFRNMNDYELLKGHAVAVSIFHDGKALLEATLEKQEGAKICQRVAITGALSHYDYVCYNVRALGADALALYNSLQGDELRVEFRDETGHSLVGTQSFQKLSQDGFCRRSMGLSSYVCYAKEN